MCPCDCFAAPRIDLTSDGHASLLQAPDNRLQIDDINQRPSATGDDDDDDDD